MATAAQAGVFYITNLTKSNGGLFFIDNGSTTVYNSTLGKLIVKSLVNGRYNLKAEISQQHGQFFTFAVNGSGNTYFNWLLKTTNNYQNYIIAETSDGILIDNTIGRQFLALGLATDAYADIDFTGIPVHCYILNTAGEQVAKIYLYVTYFFQGATYQMAGTVIPYVWNNNNLYIGLAADAVANGFVFVLNDNLDLINSVQDPLFDLSQSMSNGILTETYTQLSFNPADPAVQANAIWTYNPVLNSTSAIYGDAWNLFQDKDKSNVDMMISAGTAISNLFVKNSEEIDYNVMNTILSVCEKRKDCFSIFDGLGYSDVNVVLRKTVGIGTSGDLARWGGVYDGRSIMNDSVYTLLNVEVVQSVVLAAIITANSASGMWWLPPAGYVYGNVAPGLAVKEKYVRSYNYSADPFSGVAKLYDANINPFRVNQQGIFVYGQKTMLRRETALNRMNVIMLVAGIHKRFEAYLDQLVFQLNTSALRKNITNELQNELNLIQSSAPPGIYSGTVICDSSNNTPAIIDTNQLIVDVIIQPTRAAEYITLRTTVTRTQTQANVQSAIVGG